MLIRYIGKIFGHPDLLHFTLPVYAISILLGGAVTFAVSRQRPVLRAFIDHCLPWRKWATASTKVDIVLYVGSKLALKWIGVLSAFISVLLASKAADVAHDLLHAGARPVPGWPVVAAICAAMFVASDFGNFYSHLVQHKIPMLWEFHKVHHSASFLTPVTTYRFHPVGNLVDGLFIGPCVAVPAGLAAFFYRLSYGHLFAMTAGVELAASVFLLNTLQHTHFPIGFGPLDRLFISPRMHQVHHSVKRAHWDKNFGSRLSVWDWMFGTACQVGKLEVIEFGIGTAEDARGDYRRIWWCLLGPFVQCWRLARRGRPQNAPQTEAVVTPTAS